MQLASIRYRDRECVAVAVEDDHVVGASDLNAGVGDMRAWSREVRKGTVAAAVLAILRKRPDVARLFPVWLPGLSGLASHWCPLVRCFRKICSVAMNNSASHARTIRAPDPPAFDLKRSRGRGRGARLGRAGRNGGRIGRSRLDVRFPEASALAACRSID